MKMSSPIERRSRPRRRWRSPSAPRILAWLFLAAAGAVVGVFFLQAGAFNAMGPTPPPEDSIVAAAPVAEPAGKNRAAVSGSQFTGFDKNHQPFSVSAERAVQDRSDASKVHMHKVHAALTRTSGEEIAIRSLSALYDADEKSIALDGEVELSSRDQFTATMARATVALAEEELLAEVPVLVNHRQGEIRANGMAISDDGRRIRFFNRVRATFWGNANGENDRQ
jgi:LPS export ABC transporter protein LptC